jgi:REP element-mobilizing transposase RayT
MIDLPPPGFRALDPQLPVAIHRRHLPHWRQQGATYFVTFRLADSLPAERLLELREDRERWQREHPGPSSEEMDAQSRQHMEKVERWLDQGYGSCVLRRDDIAAIVEARLRHFDGTKYTLFSAAIMPNHAHVCVKPNGEHGLDDIVQAWKSVSAHMIGRVLKRKGQVWQDESFDRIVRDTPHLRRVVRYIEANPEKAGVAARCWTTASWNEWLGR